MVWLLALGGLCLAGCHHKVISGGTLDRQAVVRIGEQVSEIRKLAYLRPIQVGLSAPDKLRGKASSEAGEHRASGRAGAQGKLLSLLGLIPWDSDPAAAEQAIIASQPVGFYLARKDRLEIVARDYLRSEVLELASLFVGRDLTYGEIVAHELTHALQDQHFGLEPPPGSQDNSDMTLAHVAMVEGDATLVGFELGLGGLVTDLQSFLDFARRHAPDMGQRIASYHQERFKFPYLDGGSFALALQTHGGFEAINRAHLAPPRSTEQILHPEKFLLGIDPPRLPNLTTVAGSVRGYERIYEDTLGEFGVRTLLLTSNPTSRNLAARRAAGWGGDRALVLERGHGGGLMLLWVVDWDTPADAADFVDGLEDLLSGRYGAPDFAGRIESRWLSGGRIRHLEFWGSRVVFVDAPSSSDIWQMIQEAFASDGIEPLPATAHPPVTSAGLTPEQALRIKPAEPIVRRSGPRLRLGGEGGHLDVGSLLQVRGQKGSGGGLAIQSLRARARGVVTEQLDLQMAMEFELGGDTPVLLDAVISFAPVSPHLLYLGHLVLGRFRVPFSRSYLVDPELLDLNARTLGASRLSPHRRTGLMFDLDLARHGIPMRLRGGGFDGFPEGGGFGPLSAVRLDLTPTDLLEVPFRIQLGAAYMHDARHQDAESGTVQDRQGVTLDALLSFCGYHLEADLFLLTASEQDGLETTGWSVTAGAFLLPDFLQLLARYEQLHPTSAPEVQQLSAGLNLFYLSTRFKMTYNFIYRREGELPDTTRHLVVFQLLL